jgi:hypothetical protein
VYWLQRPRRSPFANELDRLLRALPTAQLGQWCAWVAAETLAGRYTRARGLQRAAELAR